jgi:hypothetical protein
MHLRTLLIAALFLFGGCTDDSKPNSGSADAGTDFAPDIRDVHTADDTSDTAEPDAEPDTADVPPDTSDVGDTNDVADVEEDLPPPFSWEAAEPQTLHVVDGLPLTQARIAEFEPELFVLDTLSQTIFVDSATIGDDLFHEEEVLIGDAALGMRVVKGRDMTPDEVWLGEDIGGLIGQLFFSDRFTFVDYPGRTVRFLVVPPGPDAPDAPGHDGVTPFEVRHEMPNFFPVVMADFGGMEIPLLADTSSRLTVITQSTFDAQPVDEQLPQRHGFRFLTNFGEDAGFLTRMPELRFGDLVVYNLVVGVVPDDNHVRAVLEPNRVFVEGFLGAQFWQRFAVGIDGQILVHGTSEGGTRRFLLYGDGSEPQELVGAWTKVGLELTRRDGAVTVEMVFEETTAAAAGILVGDVLLSVDGTSVDQISLEEVRGALRGAGGEARTLQIQRGDETLTFEVTVQDLL